MLQYVLFLRAALFYTSILKGNKCERPLFRGLLYYSIHVKRCAVSDENIAVIDVIFIGENMHL